MPKLGAHMSIAGGYYRAVDAARAVGCDCVQVFTKNNNQWRGKPISDEEAAQFREALQSQNIVDPLSHSSYLINLASPDSALRNKSIDAMVIELQRAVQLGIPFVVLHPGSYTSSSESVGLQAVASSLDEVFQQTRDWDANCLLENTAGQGTNLGWRFEHLAEIRSLCQFPRRLGVCIDTCHTLAAGYPISEPRDYANTIAELDRVIGIELVQAIHLNDSKTPLGSRRDRHEHIGRGAIGDAGFRNLLNDSRFSNVPMYLETEKGTEKGEELDAINLRRLRSLVGTAPRPASTVSRAVRAPARPKQRKAAGKQKPGRTVAKPKPQPRSTTARRPQAKR